MRLFSEGIIRMPPNEQLQRLRGALLPGDLIFLFQPLFWNSARVESWFAEPASVRPAVAILAMEIRPLRRRSSGTISSIIAASKLSWMHSRLS